MKKIIFIILFIFFLNLNFTNAFNYEKVDNLLLKIEHKIWNKPLLTQLNIYKNIRKRIFLLNKNYNNWKNKELLKYLYLKVDNKYKHIFKKYALTKKDNKIDIVKNTNLKVYFKLENYNECLDLKVKTLYLYKNWKKIEVFNDVNWKIDNIKLDWDKLYFNWYSQIDAWEKIYDINKEIFIKWINCENCKNIITCVNK